MPFDWDPQFPTRGSSCNNMKVLGLESHIRPPNGSQYHPSPRIEPKVRIKQPLEAQVSTMELLGAFGSWTLGPWYEG